MGEIERRNSKIISSSVNVNMKHILNEYYSSSTREVYPSHSQSLKGID